MGVRAVGCQEPVRVDAPSGEVSCADLVHDIQERQMATTAVIVTPK